MSLPEKGPKEVLILRHVANEGPGWIGEFLRTRKMRHRLVRLDRGERYPGDLEHVSAVVVMGGPMNVYEEKKYPFLKWEDQFIKKVLLRKIPYLGVCLGAQLLSKAAGGHVYRSPVPEIGWHSVTLTAQARRDVLFRGIRSKTLKVLQWHGDTFSIPRRGRRIATSKQVPNQAFRLGDAIGLQFHIEADGSMIRHWFRSHPKKNKIARQFSANKPRLRQTALTLMENFFLPRANFGKKC